MIIELPNVDGDRIRTGVARDGSVDVHWLELSPQADAVGPRYADLMQEIRKTRAMAPDGNLSPLLPTEPAP